MKKKYYILALTFLSFFVGQSSYAQDYQPLFEGDAPTQENKFTFDGINQLTEVVITAYSGSSSSSGSDNYLNEVVITSSGINNQTSYSTYSTYSYLVSSLSSPQSSSQLIGVDIIQSVIDYYASFTLAPPPPPIWYLDYDTDGYHGQSYQSESSPGYNWKGWTYGYDCDDNDSTKRTDCTPCTITCPTGYYLIDCECVRAPTEDAFIITDSNNPNRIVNNRQTLVMVNSGLEREASIDMTTSFGGDLTWSGTGVTGNGSSATYSGTTSTSVVVSTGPDGISATGYIQIVPEGKVSLSTEIDIVKTKINDVSDTFRSLVEAKGSTVAAGEKSCTLTGTIERKNVDMYADGTKYGTATSFNLAGTYSMTMPKIKIPIYSGGIANIFATLNLGSATASLNVQGSLDDSTAAKVDVEGGFELGFTAASGTISATLGSAEHLCVEASGGVSVAYFKVGAKVQGNSNATGLLLTPELKVGNVKATYSLSAKVDIGTISERCEIIAGEYKIWEPEEIPFSPIILYQKQ